MTAAGRARACPCGAAGPGARSGGSPAPAGGGSSRGPRRPGARRGSAPRPCRPPGWNRKRRGDPAGPPRCWAALEIPSGGSDRGRGTVLGGPQEVPRFPDPEAGPGWGVSVPTGVLGGTTWGGSRGDTDPHPRRGRFPVPAAGKTPGPGAGGRRGRAGSGSPPPRPRPRRGPWSPPGGGRPLTAGSSSPAAPVTVTPSRRHLGSPVVRPAASDELHEPHEILRVRPCTPGPAATRPVASVCPSVLRLN